MKLLNYIEESKQNEMEQEQEQEQEQEPATYEDMLTKGTKTNEVITSGDLDVKLTKDNFINEKNTEGFEEDNSNLVQNISRISEMSNTKEPAPAQKYNNLKIKSTNEKTSTSSNTNAKSVAKQVKQTTDKNKSTNSNKLQYVF